MPAAAPFPAAVRSISPAQAGAIDRPPANGGRERSPLGLIAVRFTVLDSNQRCWLDGTAIAGFPDRKVSLAEARCRLLALGTSFDCRDAAFDWLLDRIQHAGGARRDDWNVVLAGLLLPGLRATLTPICRRHWRLREDVETEALAGLWAAASGTPLGRGRVAARLTWAARRAADRYVRAELAYQCAAAAAAAQPSPGFSTSCDDEAAGGHPDALLAAAVSSGVLLAKDAELIAVTRLELEPLRMTGQRMGLSYPAAKQRRSRAEARLVAWIRRRQAQLAA